MIKKKNLRFKKTHLIETKNLKIIPNNFKISPLALRSCVPLVRKYSYNDKKKIIRFRKAHLIETISVKVFY
jgi:hypothetical protein